MDKVCDISCLDRLEASLTMLGNDLCGKEMMRAIYAGGKVLKEEARQNVLAKVRGSDSTMWRGRPHKAMYEGIRIKTDKDYREVKVHILGDFRLRWFEKGVSERYAHRYRKFDTGKKMWRGEIAATGFFAEARKNEAPVVDAIIKSLERSVKRLLK